MALPHPTKTLIAITSIPRRFDTSLRDVLRSLDGTKRPIVLSIPAAYNKWGKTTIPECLRSIENLTVHQPPVDYGPATKLLGALDYLHATGLSFDNIITFDDDCYYNDPAAVIAYLEHAAAENPGAAVTVGGIRLDRPPYRSKNGLFHGCMGFVDVVCGWRGVLYPVAPLLRDRRIFDMQAETLPGTAHEDDAYFGICLSRMQVPLVSLKELRHTTDGRPLKIMASVGAGTSAVQEHVEKDRVDNEMEILQHAVSQGWLPNRMAAQHQPSMVEVMMRRNRVLRKVVRAINR